MKTAKALIENVIDGFYYSLVLEGRGGIGKTFLVKSVLTERGLKEGEDYIYLKGYITPFSFYKVLYENKDGMIIILDDVDGLLSDNKTKAILKSVLDTGTRRLTYKTTKRTDIPSEFDFNSSIIVISNNISKDEHFKAILDRCLYYKIEVKPIQILNILENLTKKPYKELSKKARKEILEFIKRHSLYVSNEFSIRTLFKIYELYRQDKKNYKYVVLDMFKLDKAKEFIFSISQKNLSVKEQYEKYKEFAIKEGLPKSRATFFNYRKALGVEQSV